MNHKLQMIIELFYVIFILACSSILSCRIELTMISLLMFMLSYKVKKTARNLSHDGQY